MVYSAWSSAGQLGLVPDNAEGAGEDDTVEVSSDCVGDGDDMVAGLVAGVVAKG